MLFRSGRLFLLTLTFQGEGVDSVQKIVKQNLDGFDTKLYYLSQTPIVNYSHARIDLMERGGKIKDTNEAIKCFEEYFKSIHTVCAVVLDAQYTGETKLSISQVDTGKSCNPMVKIARGSI